MTEINGPLQTGEPFTENVYDANGNWVGEGVTDVYARLFAAAPDLLAALEADEYADALDRELTHQEYHGTPSEGWGRVTNVDVKNAIWRANELRKAAIAKAKGM